MMIYLLCLVLFCVGIYGLLSNRNIIKMIVGLIIAEHAAKVAVSHRQARRRRPYPHGALGLQN